VISLKLRGWWEILKIPLYLAAPPLCVLCDKPIAPDDLICRDCKDELENYRIRSPRCYVCGEPLKFSSCLRCKGEKFHFEKIRGAFTYEGPVVKLIELYKYYGIHKLSTYLGEKMVEPFLELGDVDFIVPIPLHPSRERERGFSQTHLLGRVISEKTGVPILDALIRKRNTKSQTKLGREERKKNLKDAFEVVGEIEGKSIVIVDDVLTTGITINEASKILKREGALRVKGVVGAIAPLYPPGL
jgi:ComF family protein